MSALKICEQWRSRFLDSPSRMAEKANEGAVEEKNRTFFDETANRRPSSLINCHLNLKKWQFFF